VGAKVLVHCQGLVNVPSTVSITLRMGHSLGKIRDKYIFMGEGADQYLGRCLSGLPFNDEGFTTLPPHFTDEGNLLLTHDFWEEIVPGYSHYPSGKRYT
jgi:hypothetical protein